MLDLVDERDLKKHRELYPDDRIFVSLLWHISMLPCTCEAWHRNCWVEGYGGGEAEVRLRIYIKDEKY